MSNHVPGYNFDSYSTIPCAERNGIVLGTGEPGQDDFLLQRTFSVPVPVRGMRFDGICSGYGSIMHPMYYTQSAPHNISERFPEPIDRSANNSSGQPGQKQEQKMEKMDDRGHLSSANDQSGSSNLNQVAAFRGNQEGLFIQSGNSQRSIQREAALNKFRLKRKDRCFEKKVSYLLLLWLLLLSPLLSFNMIRHCDHFLLPMYKHLVSIIDLKRGHRFVMRAEKNLRSSVPVSKDSLYDK